MSLLHKALKKAEREGAAPVEEGKPFIDTEEAPAASPWRVYFLSGLVVVGLLGVVAYRFAKKGGTSSPKQQLAASPAAPETMSSASETDRLLEEGQRFFGSADWPKARDRFEKAVVSSPRNAMAYNDLGLVLKKMGMDDEAFDQYRKALAVDPECPACLNNLGVLYLAHRDLGEAEEQFRRAIQLKPAYPDPYMHLALIMESRGDAPGAKDNYQKFIDRASGVSADFLLKIQRRVAALPSQP